MYIKYHLFLTYFNENGLFSTDFRKILKFQFYAHSFSGKRVFSWGQTDRQRDITKLTVAFRSFAKAPKKGRTFLNTLLNFLTPYASKTRPFATELRVYPIGYMAVRK